MNTLPVKRLSLFCGHYGSGKTNLAVNFALRLRSRGYPVTIADLDIVNPYFRTKDSEEELKAAGIELIALPFANSNVDLPALPAEAYRLIEDKSRYAVLDIGGDDRGAYALGRYTDEILREANYDNFFVANFLRPLTPTPESALEIMREIEEASGIPFTGIINNTNLGAETRDTTVLEGQAKAEELSRISGLPLAFTGIEESLEEELRGKIPRLFPMKLQKRPTE